MAMNATQDILDAFYAAVDKSEVLRLQARARPITTGQIGLLQKLIGAERAHAVHTLAAADKALADLFEFAALGATSPDKLVSRRPAPAPITRAAKHIAASARPTDKPASSQVPKALSAAAIPTPSKDKKMNDTATVMNEIKSLVYGSRPDHALAKALLETGEYDAVLGHLKGTFMNAIGGHVHV